MPTISPETARNLYDSEGFHDGWTYISTEIIGREHGMDETIMVIGNDAGELYGLTYRAACGEYDDILPWDYSSDPIQLTRVRAERVMVTRYRYDD